VTSLAPPADSGQRQLVDVIDPHECLVKCEAVIERGLGTFVEVGQALAEIRDRRLYKTTHQTFESYCHERWKFSASRGRQMIGAAKAVTSGNAPGARTEREARHLAQQEREATKGPPPRPDAPSVAIHVAISEHLRQIKRLAQKWEPSMIEGVKPGQCEKDLRAGREVAKFLEEFLPTVATKGTPLRSVSR
jgi:hypothetical protein